MKIQVDKHIQIAHLGPEHIQSLFTLTNHNREHLKNWLGWIDLVKTLGDTQTFIETAIHQHNHGESTTFAILYKEEIIGIAGFNHLDQTNNWGAIGYWLCQTHTGKGTITKVVNRLLDYGFEEQKLNKIEIRCATGNYRSRAVPERLGLTFEGTLRQCEWLYSKYVDHAVYSMLRSEYKDKRFKEIKSKL